MDAVEQPEPSAPEAEIRTNIDRLLGHLPDDSLAATLVRNVRDVAPGQSAKDAMKAVIQARVEEMKVPRDTAED